MVKANVEDHVDGNNARPRSMENERPCTIREPREYFSLFFTDDYVVIFMNSHMSNPCIDTEYFKMSMSALIYFPLYPFCLVLRSWRKARQKRRVPQASDYITRDRFLQLKAATYLTATLQTLQQWT